MDDGLVLLKQDVSEVVTEGLNPYCSGQWSRTCRLETKFKFKQEVLILVVVDDGLVLLGFIQSVPALLVLILVVVDDGLVL